MEEKKNLRDRMATYGRAKLGLGLNGKNDSGQAGTEKQAGVHPEDAELNERIKGYGKEYSEKSFWDKIKKFGKSAGVKVVYAALLLFYTLKDADVPPWAKSVIIGALAYFIAPIDLIPDFIPVAGYTDDFGTLLAAIAVVAKHIDDKSRGKARARLVSWFGESATLHLGEVEERLEPLSSSRDKGKIADADPRDSKSK